MAFRIHSTGTSDPTARTCVCRQSGFNQNEGGLSSLHTRVCARRETIGPFLSSFSSLHISASPLGTNLTFRPLIVIFSSLITLTNNLTYCGVCNEISTWGPWTDFPLVSRWL